MRYFFSRESESCGLFSHILAHVQTNNICLSLIYTRIIVHHFIPSLNSSLYRYLFPHILNLRIRRSLQLICIIYFFLFLFILEVSVIELKMEGQAVRRRISTITAHLLPSADEFSASHVLPMVKNQNIIY